MGSNGSVKVLFGKKQRRDLDILNQVMLPKMVDKAVLLRPNAWFEK